MGNYSQSFLQNIYSILSDSFVTFNNNKFFIFKCFLTFCCFLPLAVLVYIIPLFGYITCFFIINILFFAFNNEIYLMNNGEKPKIFRGLIKAFDRGGRVFVWSILFVLLPMLFAILIGLLFKVMFIDLTMVPEKIMTCFGFFSLVLIFLWQRFSSIIIALEDLTFLQTLKQSFDNIIKSCWLMLTLLFILGIGFAFFELVLFFTLSLSNYLINGNIFLKTAAAIIPLIIAFLMVSVGWSFLMLWLIATIKIYKRNSTIIKQ